MIDLDRLRGETPSCFERIHTNNAGASPSPLPVIEAVVNHIQLEAEVGGYAAEAEALADIKDFYDAFATLLNCRRDEIAYIENATRAWDMAFYAIPFQPGDRIITCASEYASNYLAFLHMKQTKGVEIDVAPNDAAGQVDVEALEHLIGPRTLLIAITHVPTQGGLVNPVKAIGKVARAHGVLFLLDACQSLGQMPVDVQEIGCDILSGTGRKFLRGPRGTGLLYVKSALLRTLHPPFVDLHAATWVSADSYVLRQDARRFENWESNVAGRIGLGVAVRYALGIGLEPIQQRVKILANRLREQLSEDPRVITHDLGTEKCGIITLRKQDEDPLETQKRLAEAKISSSVSAVSSARLDLEARGIESLLRLSVHYFNTEEEIDRVVDVVLRRG